MDGSSEIALVRRACKTATASSIPLSEVAAVKQLPPGPIDAAGMSEDYSAFRARYMAWRQGKGRGAKGEIGRELTRSHTTLLAGFGHWYPTMVVWQFRRSISYWISVTFFEGSLFFTISSFLWLFPEKLGDLQFALTTGGYIAGKVNFVICTYLMCIETINLSANEQERASKRRLTAELSSSDVSDFDSDSGSEDSFDGESRFRLNPFRHQKALANLDRLGAGPWPYYASVVYFIGVLTFGIGLAAEFTPGLSEDVIKWTGLITFLFGSIFFTIGGLAECIENEVFVTLKMDSGYVGAAFNTLGGVLFLVGAILGFFDGYGFESMFAYFLGSFIFALGSAVMIVMWKDEQFGLTFLAVLNRLGGPHGRPLVSKDGHGPEEEQTFSWRGSVFIMVYCLAATLSVYNFNIAITVLFNAPGDSDAYIIERAITNLYPAIFAHMMLALNSAIVKTPQAAPFHQLYIASRWVAVLMVFNGGARIDESLRYIGRHGGHWNPPVPH